MQFSFCCSALYWGCKQQPIILSIHRGMTMFDFHQEPATAAGSVTAAPSPSWKGLTNRELADLGLTTYDIPRVAREAARF